MSNSLDDLEKLWLALDRFGGQKAVRPELPEQSALKLAALQASGRPFLMETEQVKEAVVDAVRTELKSGRIDGETWDNAAAQAVRAEVIRRFREQGGDITLTELKPSTVARKARVGLDPRIGIAHPSTGLLHDLETVPWRTVRRG